MNDIKAKFVDRNNCISCESTNLMELSSRSFNEDPVKSFIENDPWEEPPLKYIRHVSWSLVKCSDCGQKFHKTILSPEWMTKCYSEWVSNAAIEKFERIHCKPGWKLDKGKDNTLHFLRLEKLTRNLRKLEPIRILDFGCGYGDFLSICDKFDAIAYGVDFSPERRLMGKVKIFPDIENLRSTLPTNYRFHAIVMFEVLEHLSEPLIVIKQLNKLLAPGGVLILTTPDCKELSSIESPADYRLVNPLSHINAFTSISLRKIAENAGFTQIRPPTAHVTSDGYKIFKTEIKRWIKPILPKNTQQYFIKKN